jgi:hypothetical protein
MRALPQRNASDGIAPMWAAGCCYCCSTTPALTSCRPIRVVTLSSQHRSTAAPPIATRKRSGRGSRSGGNRRRDVAPGSVERRLSQPSCTAVVIMERSVRELPRHDRRKAVWSNPLVNIGIFLASF